MRKSAGILLYRKHEGVEVFLIHHGGPYWTDKELGAWSIPKGEYPDTEDPLAAAVRELEEETGYMVNGPFIPLTPIKQKAGKLVMAWAAEGNLNPETIQSNTFKMQWPPKSGKWIEVPEVDKAAWFTPQKAKQMINPAQAPFIDELIQYLTA
jgi:predicted NUDIX family NTP pyrophosphohydrolase